MPTLTTNRVPVTVNGITRWQEAPATHAKTKKVSFRTSMGQVMREERQLAGKSLRQYPNISMGFLSELERGVTEGSSETLSLVCQNLGITMPELLRRTADKMEMA